MSPPARTEGNSQSWHPAAKGRVGGDSQQGTDLLCPFFFSLCRLTDPALAEVFSDHNHLIAWGKHFLAVTSAPVLARRVFLARHTAVPREGQPQQGRHKPCQADSTCTGAPGEALERPDPLAHPPLGQAAGKILGGQKRSSGPPNPGCRTGFSLGEFQRCSFHFRAAGGAADGHLKGISGA